jgi:hypothetical protein
MKLKDTLNGLSQILRPVHDRPEILRVLDPIIGFAAATALVYASTLGFAAFGMLLACAFVAYQILTRIFGVSFDFDPAMFQKYAQGPATH